MRVDVHAEGVGEAGENGDPGGEEGGKERTGCGVQCDFGRDLVGRDYRIGMLLWRESQKLVFR